ncbi:MAG: mannitol dehydrogenase family protein [Granulosicoccus sp.]
MTISSESKSQTPFNLDSLSALPANVTGPSYSRDALRGGILHFGPGNFHKAHQAVFIDRLMNLGSDLDWAIIGASVVPSDVALRQTALEQNLLTTVVTQSASVSEAHVTGAMIDYLPVGDTYSILATMDNPAIRIVSLTVTEGGYFVDAATGKFDDHHPAIEADIANFDKPGTVFGLIVKGLQRRRAAGENAFTVMSCDNLPHNGKATRQAVLGFAERVDPSLARWIAENSSFPNGMVDRITPATGDHERSRVRELFGINDKAPVFCEDYIQWVLEDDFVSGRPAFEKAGVEIVEDVSPFEAMKIRILNGGHAVLAYPAALLGIEFAHEALQNQLIRDYLKTVETREIIPVVGDVPGTDLNEYSQLVLTRFANPAIADTITRLCFDGFNRQPKFIVPTIEDRLKQGGGIQGLALATALWCRYCEGRAESGQTIAPNDPVWDTLHARAVESQNDPLAWIGMRDVYGDLGEDPVFQNSFREAIDGIRNKGVAQMLVDYCATQAP